MPIFLILRQVYLCLALLCLGFLETENIRLCFFEEWEKEAFAMDSSEPVNIPGDYFHLSPIVSRKTEYLCVSLLYFFHEMVCRSYCRCYCCNWCLVRSRRR